MRTNKQATVALSLTAAILASATTAPAEDQELVEKVKKLEERVAELEGKGPAAAAAKGTPWEAWIGAVKFSGFASASYLYNFNRPSALTAAPIGGATDYTRGRSFDGAHNEFALNKLKLALEKPVDYSATNWDVGFRADLIFGQDAALIQSGGLALGSHGDLEQLYVTVNVPIGRGLQVSAGKWVTLMGVEVIEETANPNWSEGNQFLSVRTLPAPVFN